ncbi:MAG: hypothetical protein AB1597_03295, partial [Chloroflexota bacterium]
MTSAPGTYGKNNDYGFGRLNLGDAPPNIILISPNGGETWPLGTSRNITWASYNINGNVKIELSRNNGSTWETLFADIPNNGTQTWTAAGNATTQARVRVASVANPTQTDTSDAAFTISPLTPPSVTTGPATAVTSSTATLNGNLISLGSATTINVSFEYGITTSYGSTTTPEAKTTTGAFNAAVTGLTSATTYHYRAKADGGTAGTSYGDDATFTTTTAAASIQVNDGSTVTLSPGGSRSNIPIAIKNIPNLGTGNGVGGFTFSLSWNKDVITIDSLTGATITGWTIIPGTPNNTSGTATITGYTSNSFLTADTVVGNLSITAVGASGTSTTIGISVTSLGDKDGTAIPSTTTGAPVSIVSMVAETALSTGIDTDNVAVVNVKINRGKN